MERAEENHILWRSFPLRDDWPRSILAVAAVLGFSVLALFAAGIYFAALSLVVLVMSLIKYFLPTVYRADDKHICVSFLGVKRVRPWSYFINYYPHDVGVHLTPMASSSILDAFRGQFLRFNKNRNEVLKYVKERIEGTTEKNGN